MTNPDQAHLLRIAHSPDPDDAFMWWPLQAKAGTPPRIDTGRWRFEPVIQDIEILNRRSEHGDLEITAMSCAQYPRVQDKYALTSCGASLGDNYGPKLVARESLTADGLTEPGTVIAIPGERTSAYGATCLLLGKGNFQHQPVPFDEIIPRVASGEFTAGLVIHEGQLTFEAAGLHLIEDLGKWWFNRRQLPLPLGVNAIRRDLEELHGPGTLIEITTILLRSVQYALAHRDESIRVALHYARNMGADLADEFVNLYVNRWTVEFGEIGRAAVRTFLDELSAEGLTPRTDTIDFIPAAGGLNPS